MQKEVFMAPDGSLPCLPLQYFFGFSGLDLKFECRYLRQEECRKMGLWDEHLAVFYKVQGNEVLATLPGWH